MGDPVKIARFKARVAATKRELRAERARKAKVTAAPVRLVAPILGATWRPASPPPEAIGAGVYLLREQGTNFVKIGWTSDFRRRYPSMRVTCNPRKLVFLGWLSRQDHEGRFHSECARYSVGGNAGGTEWFEMPDDKIADLVAACEAP
jgi:hypothetical protein